MKKVKLNNNDFKSLDSVSDLLENTVLKTAVFDIANDQKMGGRATASEFTQDGYAQVVFSQLAFGN